MWNHVRQKKEGERRGQEVGWDLLLGGDLKKLRSSRTQGNPPPGGAGWLGQKEIFWACRRAVRQPVYGRQDKVRPTEMVYATALYLRAWDLCLSVYMGPGCWNTGNGEKSWGGLLLAISRQDSLKGWKWENSQLGILVEEAWTTTEARSHYWVTCRGWSVIVTCRAWGVIVTCRGWSVIVTCWGGASLWRAGGGVTLQPLPTLSASTHTPQGGENGSCQGELSHACH